MRIFGIAGALGLALATTGAPAAAANGVDPATIGFKDWGTSKPATLTVVAARGAVKKAVFFDDNFSFRWEGSPAMSAIGTELLARNGIQPDERMPRVVKELYLGPPAGVPLPGRSPGTGGSDVRLSLEHLREIPPGAVRVLLTRTGAGIWAGQAITISFDAALPDDELRHIHFEEGVLRVLGYRED